MDSFLSNVTVWHWLFLLVVMLLTWGFRAMGAVHFLSAFDATAQKNALLFVQHAFDTAEIDIAAAVAPDSDGGALITAAERSAILAKAGANLLANATGSFKTWLEAQGGPFLAGLLGHALDTILSRKAGTLVPAAPPAFISGATITPLPAAT